MTKNNNFIGQIQKSIAVFCIILIASCDFLSIENYTDNELAIDSIFTRQRYLEAFMWGVADWFPDEGERFRGGGIYTPGPMASDEAFCLFATDQFQGMAYVLGERSAQNLGSLDKWKQMYQVIRQCNTILARMNECVDCTIEANNRIRAYTRFFRAYAYYNLLMNHGPVILLGDEVVSNNEDMAYYDRPRNLYDECVNYICDEFENAALHLPTRIYAIDEFGRPTRGAALGLVARLRLQHASDLYNGGRSARIYFGSWVRADGQHYIQQNYDPRRWAVAAAAAKRVIDLRDDGGLRMYALHTVIADNETPELPADLDDTKYYEDWDDNGNGGAAAIDPYLSYLNMFNGETVMTVNREFVWARASSVMATYTRHSFPASYSGYNGMAVTQKVVDAYEMIDGTPITTSDLYSESGFTTSWNNSVFSGYRLPAGVSNMYVNREARFYASIGFSGALWTMHSVTENSNRDQIVQYYSDSPNGRDGAPNPNDHPATGYVIRKFIHPIDAWQGTGNRVLGKPYPIIRYAEILLAYAEALNQLGDNSFDIDVNGDLINFRRNTEEIRWAYNQVRYRAGLPGLTNAELANAETVMNKIKRERMVEFLYENHRYFDVRRWGDYEESEGTPIMGMNTSATRDAYYQRVVPASARIARRVFDRKMIFVPIPHDEVRRLPQLDQNPGW